MRKTMQGIKWEHHQRGTIKMKQAEILTFKILITELKNSLQCFKIIYHEKREELFNLNTWSLKSLSWRQKKMMEDEDSIGDSCDYHT